MKILFYGDVHIKDNSGYPNYNGATERNGLTRNLLNTLRGLNFVADKIKEIKPDLVINLGDTFNNPDEVSTRAIVTAHQGFTSIKNACNAADIGHYILDGNHDILSSSQKLSNTQLLNGYCTSVISEQSMLDIRDFRIGFVPFTSNQTTIHDNITEAINNGCDIVCTHCEFAGAIYENGRKSESIMGTKWDVPIFSGHIHLRQQINDVMYVGSLIQGRFDSKKFNKNGISVYDTETKKTENHFNKNSKHFMKVDNLDEFEATYKNTSFFQNIIAQVVIGQDVEKEAVESRLNEMGLVDFIITRKYDKIEAEENVKYIDFTISDPKALLRDHIEYNNNDAIDTFNGVCEV